MMIATAETYVEQLLTSAARIGQGIRRVCARLNKGVSWKVLSGPIKLAILLLKVL
jgi:hypothetical protein